MTDFKKFNRMASFRGVQFHVRENSYESGRRLETHEYPGADIPMTEDLGRKAYKIQLTAFVNGTDWRQQSEKLQDALDARGHGKLVQPDGQSFEVYVESYNIRESTKIYESEFTITFVESGDQPAPIITNSLLDMLASLADELYITSAIEFMQMATDYATAIVETVSAVASAVVSGLSSIVDGIQGIANTITGAIDSLVNVALELDDLENNVTTLLNTPNKWSARIQGAFAVVTNLLPSSKKNIHNILHTSDTDVKIDYIDKNTNVGKSTYRASVRTNNFNLATSIAATMKVIAKIDVSNNASGDFRRADIIEIRDDLIRASDEILNSDIDMSVEFTTKLSECVTAAVAACNDIIGKLPNLREIELPRQTSARVLAHELYNEQSRSVEIANENLVQNPTFLPAGTKLQVLDK